MCEVLYTRIDIPEVYLGTVDVQVTRFFLCRNDVRLVDILNTHLNTRKCYYRIVDVRFDIRKRLCVDVRVLHTHLDIRESYCGTVDDWGTRVLVSVRDT